MMGATVALNPYELTRPSVLNTTASTFAALS